MMMMMMMESEPMRCAVSVRVRLEVIEPPHLIMKCVDAVITTPYRQYSNIA